MVAKRFADVIWSLAERYPWLRPGNVLKVKSEAVCELMRKAYDEGYDAGFAEAKSANFFGDIFRGGKN